MQAKTWVKNNTWGPRSWSNVIVSGFELSSVQISLRIKGIPFLLRVEEGSSVLASPDMSGKLFFQGDSYKTLWLTESEMR